MKPIICRTALSVFLAACALAPAAHAQLASAGVGVAFGDRARPEWSAATDVAMKIGLEKVPAEQGDTIAALLRERGFAADANTLGYVRDNNPNLADRDVRAGEAVHLPTLITGSARGGVISLTSQLPEHLKLDAVFNDIEGDFRRVIAGLPSQSDERRALSESQTRLRVVEDMLRRLPPETEHLDALRQLQVRTTGATAADAPALSAETDRVTANIRSEILSDLSGELGVAPAPEPARNDACLLFWAVEGYKAFRRTERPHRMRFPLEREPIPVNPAFLRVWLTTRDDEDHPISDEVSVNPSDMASHEPYYRVPISLRESCR